MSLNKNLCLRSDSQNSLSFSDCVFIQFQSKEVNYRRDLLSDRFCDDLCEDILQYLPLKNKLRLQCVSKQFQRTVFQRQNELYLNVCDPEEHKSYIINKTHRKRYQNYYYIEDQSMDSFKALLKKCPNITSIEFSDNYMFHEIHEVFRLIIENCNNLSEIIGLYDIIGSNFEEFHQKFAQKIKCLRFERKLIDLNLFPNIEKIILFRHPFHTDTFNVDSIIPRLNLAKLKKLEIDLREGQEKVLQTFIDKFPKLTHLCVDFKSDDKNAIYNSLKNISKLKHLIHFKLNTRFIYYRFYGLLKQMANNCKNLKSIDCRSKINQNSDLRQLLSQLKAFSLKRLNLCLFFEEDIDVNKLFSFELFKGFENITHLRLYFRSDQPLKESTLKEIEIYLPKLQYLKIDKEFDTTPEGVAQMADILSRLSRLETLKLRFKLIIFIWESFNSGIYFELSKFQEQFTEKCRKIKTIEIRSDSESKDYYDFEFYSNDFDWVLD